MTIPDAVAKAWKDFADHVDVTQVSDDDYRRLANVALAAHTGGVGLDALGDAVIDLASTDGAPDFLAGELTTGLDIALRALTGYAAHTSAVAEEAAKQSAAEQARDAALTKLTPEERKALGL